MAFLSCSASALSWSSSFILAKCVDWGRRYGKGTTRRSLFAQQSPPFL